MDGMFLVVNWICTGCVLDVVFVHILKNHCKHSKASAINHQHQLRHIKHIQVSSIFKHRLQTCHPS